MQVSGTIMICESSCPLCYSTSLHNQPFDPDADSGHQQILKISKSAVKSRPFCRTFIEAMKIAKTYLLGTLLCTTLLLATASSFAQTDSAKIAAILKNNPANSKWGPNDTIVVAAIWHDGQMMPYKELEPCWISNMSPRKLEKYKQEWTRLRNAVFVTYPYAMVAGNTINDINKQLEGVTSKKKRKEYIKTREKELRKQFTDPMKNLSVYQGKVLMKLINRQTGNNCYEIVKEYKGGVNARMYQTVAFFVGGNLKQDWDLTQDDDKQIEGFVRELERQWYGPNYHSGR